jgi:Protein kinase domain
VSDGFSPLWDVGGLPVGARIAGYRLEEQIGRGGMAMVFRAHDERLNRPVALKILAPALAANGAFRQRFGRESRAAASVDDPNIIPVFEAGQADGVLFIAMRLVRGGDVRSLVAGDGPLPPERAGWIVSAMASALDAAHSAGLVHRDVKPANMLLEARPGRPDHVYLSDFGVTKGSLSSTGLTGSGQFVGTVDYAAPEQLQGQEVDGRTDQYALGCSAFELLCGEPPFARSLGLATVYAHLSEKPPSLAARRASLSDAVDDVFAKVLAKSSADRYATCREFADALRSALRAQPVPADRAVSSPARQATDVVWLEPAAVATRPPRLSGAAETDLAAGPDRASAISRGDPAPPGAAGPPARRPAGERSRLRSRPLILGSLVSLAVAGAVAGLLFARAPAARATPAVSYVFAPERYGRGLVIVRHWTLSGSGGSLLTEKLTVTSATGRAQLTPFEEPVPTAITATLQAARFDPAPSRIMNPDHAVQWQLRVPAHGRVVVGYRVRVAPAGATRARLARWAKDLDSLAAQLAEKTVTVQVRSLKVRPRAALTVGHTVRLTLSGVLADGKTAPEAVLSTAVWSTGNSAVATVSASGVVTGRGAGTTRVTVRVGSARASVVVTVTGTGGGVPAPSSTTPASPKPRPNPTPTLTPTPLGG